MLYPSSTEIHLHKVLWGAAPFLVCRTVTPLDVRSERSCCNCEPCRSSRRRTRMDALSHPFGNHYDPPVSRYELARKLRSKHDICRDVFARDNAVVLLNMMVTEPIFVAICPVFAEGLSLRYHVQDVICDVPDEFRSLTGLFFSRLKIYDLRHKGCKLLRRALRSHSIPPPLTLWTVPEVYDPWSTSVEVLSEPTGILPKFPNFSNFPSSIERLVRERHFHGTRALNFEFSGLTEMSDSSSRGRKSRRSLVSFCLFDFSKFSYLAIALIYNILERT